MKETGDSWLCRRWVLGPEKQNEPLVREGAYRGLTGDKGLELRSLSAQESAARARQLRGRAGWIDLDVSPARRAGRRGGDADQPAAAAGREGAEPEGASGPVAERERPEGEGGRRRGVA
jgi:hypothetical protein